MFPQHFIAQTDTVQIPMLNDQFQSRLYSSGRQQFSNLLHLFSRRNHRPVIEFRIKLSDSAVQLPDSAVQLSSSSVQSSKSSSSCRIHRRVVKITFGFGAGQPFHARRPDVTRSSAGRPPAHAFAGPTCRPGSGVRHRSEVMTFPEFDNCTANLTTLRRF